MTSQVDNGKLGGIVGADAYCQTLADAASLPGAYKAWLTGSDPNSAPAMRFGSEGFAGWYRLRTNPPTGVAEGWGDLTKVNEDMPANYLRAAISVDEKGMDVGDASVWTNTRPDGMQVDAISTCTSWTSLSADFDGNTGRATASVVDKLWTNRSFSECNSGARLYCFQTA